MSAPDMKSVEVAERALSDLCTRDVIQLLDSGEEKQARAVMKMTGMSKTDMDKTVKEHEEMNEEQRLYEWCCLQALLHKAGLLSAERREKLRELAEGEDEDFFTHYLKEVEKNVDNLRLEVTEEGN